MNKAVRWFSEIDKEDIPIVGGKGANLGELSALNVPVPNGFIVTSPAFFQFLDSSGNRDRIKKILSNVDANDSTLLDEVSGHIKQDILKSKIPDDIASDIKECYRKLGSEEKNLLVAVRSSATAEDLPDASFAGQQATFLNISGEKDLLDAVKRCWASLYEPRAIFYRQEKKFDHFKVGIAVVVQKMIQSEVSGVMFTVDPVENDKNTIVVEAVWGLGEFIVQGTVNPDHYEINKQNLTIKNKQIVRQSSQLIKVGNQNKEIAVAASFQKLQKLSDRHIKSIAKLGKAIENHYGFPQDLEWALEGNKLYLVQTRAITTLSEKKEKSTIAIDLPVILTGAPASPGIAIGKAVILKSAKEIHKIKKGDILVASMTNPDFVPAMKKAAAIITDKGGRTSHAAIVSRELGIPCVVGTDTATKKLAKERSIITVNGREGLVYKGALSQQRLSAIAFEETKKVEEVQKLKTATKVYVNLGEKELAQEVARRSVDGIGLLRAEFMIADIGIHPRKIIKDRKQKMYIDKLASSIAEFTSAFDPRTVIYRATDFKSNEYKNLKGGAEFEEDEVNPLLGFRGAYRYIADSQVFQMELEAIKKVRNKMGFKNLWLMIPFVRTIDEMTAIKKLVSSAGLHRSGTFKLLMMAEIPSNVLLIDKFLDIGIDGISIGSNDLTMLLLGLDRDNAKISGEFSEMDDAVIESFEKLISACKKRNLYSGICGQAPSVYPELTKKLVELGISSISVSPDAIENTRKAVYEAEKELVTKKSSRN